MAGLFKQVQNHPQGGADAFAVGRGHADDRRIAEAGQFLF